MNHLDLFSGIGGFALAARRAGCTTVAFCEIDPFCQKVLRRHWPTTPIVSDVSTYLPQATPASHSAQPLEDATTPPTCGPKRSASFELCDRVGCYLRTCLELGLSTLSGRVVRSKVKAMPSGRSILVLRSATTLGGASGLWPTTTAKANHNSPSMRKWPAYARLQDAGEPEPVGMDDGLSGRMDRMKSLGNSIEPAVAELLIRAVCK
jgi:hypothetical protein